MKTNKTVTWGACSVLWKQRKTRRWLKTKTVRSRREHKMKRKTMLIGETEGRARRRCVGDMEGGAGWAHPRLVGESGGKYAGDAPWFTLVLACVEAWDPSGSRPFYTICCVGRRGWVRATCECACVPLCALGAVSVCTEACGGGVMLNCASGAAGWGRRDDLGNRYREKKTNPQASALSHIDVVVEMHAEPHTRAHTHCSQLIRPL